MEVIIDANIVIAMLIKPGKPLDLFLKEELEIFAPELLLQELENHKELILRKSRLNLEELNLFFIFLKERISLVPEEEFLKYREEANTLCPDPKDILYFALALHLQCPIWSNEKKLKEQRKIKVYATHDLMKLFHLS